MTLPDVRNGRRTRGARFAPPTAGPRPCLVRPLFYPIGGRDCPAWPRDQLLIIGCYADKIGRRRSSAASSPE
jgi:hypothetical protein